MLNLDFEAQGRGSTFILCHGRLKIAILLHKRVTVRFDLKAAVPIKNVCPFVCLSGIKTKRNPLNSMMPL